MGLNSLSVETIKASGRVGMTNRSIRVLCIDEQPLILAYVESMLNAEPGLIFAGGAASGEEGIRLFRLRLPDIALVDLRLNGMGGTRTIAAIRSEFPQARTIALSACAGDDDIHGALLAGAQGYILKNLFHKELIGAIRRVQAGGRWVTAEAASQPARHEPRGELSRREREVLRLMAHGQGNKQIAGILQISENTVKFHVKGILSKLGVSTRTHAVTVAVQRGILHLD